MAASEEPAGVRSLLDRFRGGRVAQLALQQALASGSRGAAQAAEDDARLERHSDAESVAPSGASVTHHSPVAVPLEVEFSQASQQSSLYQDEWEEAGGADAAWEAAPPAGRALPGIAEERSGEAVEPGWAADGSTKPASPSSPASPQPVLAEGSPSRSATPAAELDGSPSSSPSSLDAGADDDALLLSALLNRPANGGPLAQVPTAKSPPALRRLRGELQQEVSAGADVFSPLAAVVSEHSFEDGGLKPQGRTSGASVAQRSPSLAFPLEPSVSLAEQAAEAASVVHGGAAGDSSDEQHDRTGLGQQSQAAAQEEEEEPLPPAAARPHTARRPGTESKSALHHLRRAATPLTAALKSSGLRGSGGALPGQAQEEPGAAQQGAQQQKQHVVGERMQAIRQQVWSFDGIPQGRATIPTSHSPSDHLLPEERAGPALRPKLAAGKGPSARAAAAGPSKHQPPAPGGRQQAGSAAQPRPQPMNIGGRGSSWAPPGSGGRAAMGPTAAASTGQLPGQGVADAMRQCAGAQDAEGAPAGVVPGGGGSGSGSWPCQGAEEGEACISSEDALQALAGRQQPSAAAQQGKGGAGWPLQQELTPEQHAVAHATYRHDKFMSHLDRLSQLMAQRLQKRQREQDSLIQGVAGFEAAVRSRQLGGSGGGSCGGGDVEQEAQEAESASSPVLQPEEWRAGAGVQQWEALMVRARGRLGEQGPGSGQSSPGSAGARERRTRFAHQEAGSGSGSASSEAEPEEDSVQRSSGSSTPRHRAAMAARRLQAPNLTGTCVARPGQPPAELDVLSTAVPAPIPADGPDANAAEDTAAAGSAPAPAPDSVSVAAQEPSCSNPNPASSLSPLELSATEGAVEVVAAAVGAQHPNAMGSPKQPKTIMQVKGEQDLALRHLAAAPRTFRANPLPLSAVKPRFAQLAEQAQQRRAQAREQRLELLRSQERPFSFYQRDKERQQAALTAAAAGGNSPCAPALNHSRAETPPPFIAHPVPVSTTEARYALLVAEMALQNRTFGGRSLTRSPSAGALRPATAGAAPLRAREALPPRAASSHWHWEGSSPGGGGLLHEAGAFLLGEAAVEVAAAGLEAAAAEVGGDGQDALVGPGDRQQAAAADAAGMEAAVVSGRTLEAAGAGVVAAVMSGSSSGDARTEAEAAAGSSGTLGADADASNEQAAMVNCGAPVAATEEEAAVASAGVLDSPEASASAAGAAEGGLDVQQAAAVPAAEALVGSPAADAVVADAQPPAPVDTCGRPHSSAAAKARPCSGSPRVGSTRSAVLKLRAAQVGLASGRFATEAERTSATEQELCDMHLLCSSPKRRPAKAAAGLESLADISPGPTTAPAARPASAARTAPVQPVRGTTGSAGASQLGSAPAAAAQCPKVDRGRLVAAHETALGCDRQAAGTGAAGPPSQPAAENSHELEASSSCSLHEMGSPCGIAVPVGKDGCGGGGPGSPTPTGLEPCHAWLLSTEVTLQAAGSPMLAAPVQSPSINSSGAAEHVAGAAGAAPAPGGRQLSPGSAGGTEGQERRDTPLAHIEARHRQAEAAAKEEVRRALLKRGLAVYNYVEGGAS